MMSYTPLHTAVTSAMRNQTANLSYACFPLEQKRLTIAPRYGCTLLPLRSLHVGALFGQRRFRLYARFDLDELFVFFGLEKTI